MDEKEPSGGGISPKEVYLVKTDNEGKEQWIKPFGISELGDTNPAHQVPEGGYIVAEREESCGLGLLDAIDHASDYLIGETINVCGGERGWLDRG